MFHGRLQDGRRSHVFQMVMEKIIFRCFFMNRVQIWGEGLCVAPPCARGARAWMVNSTIRTVGTKGELSLGFPFAISVFQRRGWK